MPPLKEDDTRVLTGFDLQTASTLYWKAIPVLLKQHDREDQVEQLTFRILSGVTRQNHNLRVSSKPSWCPSAVARPPVCAVPRALLLVHCTHTPRRPAPQVLRIHASSEDDPFFLHTLEVSEEDFQGLKADQGILVDFGNFPGKIISLLERCLASQSSDMPRFQVCYEQHTPWVRDATSPVSGWARCRAGRERRRWAGGWSKSPSRRSSAAALLRA
jgi:spindle assembly abnormal protein 6